MNNHNVALIAYHRYSPLPPLMMPEDEYGRRPLNGLQDVADPLCGSKTGANLLTRSGVWSPGRCSATAMGRAVPCSVAANKGVPCARSAPWTGRRVEAVTERRGRDGRARPRRRRDGPGGRARDAERRPNDEGMRRDTRARQRRRRGGPGGRGRDAERPTNGEGMRRDGQARPRGRRDGPGAVHVRDLAWPTIRGKDA
ncbi:hypothetical protein PVAP13_2KG016628 [Panicum virgatum]|uniref:Uncharacterized protein n=1 Tax=Panicum virgatum TaxID=38727 RepID=A0A8T0VY38_PANVG|nr:hypothetical protein PVAP13_2KG016628 [Panicum virgatum]